MRARWPPGRTSASRPRSRSPPVSVPVTTVPLPRIVNTRSMNCRGRPPVAGAGAAATIASSAARRSSMPSPVCAEQATIGAPASRVPSSRARTSSVRASSVCRVDQVALGERDHRALGAEHVHDLQVLLGLRLPSLVGGDDEQDQPHRADPREHVADEPLVPGNVDEADLAPRRQHAPREPEVDGQPAALLLGEAVRVHAGEAKDQRRLAVIDVPGRRHDLRRRRRVIPVPARSGSRAASRSSSSGGTVRRSKRRGPRRSGRTPAAGRARRRAATPPGRRAGMRQPPRARAWPGSEPPPNARLARAATARRRSARRSPRARSRSRRRGCPSIRQIGISLAPARRVQAERGLERGHVHLVHPHRPGDGDAAEPRDQVGAPDDDPGLRSAEQLVAGECDQVRAGAERLGHRGLVRGHAGIAVEQPAPHVVARAGYRRAAPARRGRPPAPRR